MFRRLYEATPPGRDPVLPLQNSDLLAQYVHNDVGRRLLAQPGAPVSFVRGSIRADQIQQHRPSYINALLIQSRGRSLAQPCIGCRIHQGMRPFTECRHVPGAFGGSCANCKWHDRASRCSVRDDLWEDLGLQQQSLPSRGRQQVQSHRQEVRALLPGNTVQNPVNLDPEEGDSGNPIDLDNGEESGEEGTSGNPIRV